MAVPTVERAEVLRKQVAGPVLLPGHPDYDDVRRIHNGLIDKRPSLIARCLDASDVSGAVRFGVDAALEISVRGGGHNVAGKAVTDGGLMIDLSLMKSVEVDPDARTIRAGGGVTWGEFNAAAHADGLATTGGVVSTTGIAGLTLGGGLGWNMGKYGMAIDNLVEAEVVLASGDIVTASEANEPDLFWAIRGGGGNFGVVTRFTYRAYPMTNVLGGAVVHALSQAPRVLRFFREFTADLPDELTVNAAFRHAPDGSGTKLCALPMCHVGEDEARAAEELRPLREFGPPAADLIDRIPYPVVNTLIDDIFPKGLSAYWKSAFLAELSDEALDTLARGFEAAPTEHCAAVVENLHGAVTRIAPTDTAFPHRAPGYNVTLLSQWAEPQQQDETVSWTRSIFDALRPWMADSVYVNYMDRDDTSRVRAAYGPNYERLVELKRRYDPENLFRLNMNIAP